MINIKRPVIRIVVIVTSLLCWNLCCAADLPSTRKSLRVLAKVRPVLAQELSKQGLSLNSPIFIRIFKASRELEVWVKNSERFELFKTYKVCSFSGLFGPKTKINDLQSPEGFYHVAPDQLNPSSQYHLAFNLGYPNPYDQAHGRTGSALMVHGDCVSIGCYAVTDEKMEEIYTIADAAFRGGQPFFRVHIFPFRMTRKNMKMHKRSEWYRFWKNLKQGYDIFETDRKPPNVIVKNKRYVFERT